jgi:hypothetical protein
MRRNACLVRRRHRGRLRDARWRQGRQITGEISQGISRRRAVRQFHAPFVFREREAILGEVIRQVLNHPLPRRRRDVLVQMPSWS